MSVSSSVGLTACLTGLLDFRPRVAITGCGGKTSLMIALGVEYASRGRSVLITTTTKLRSPYELDYGCDSIFLDSTDGICAEPGRRVFYARTFDDGRTNRRKVCSPDLAELARLAKDFDVVLMEADGSRGLPLKYHHPWDPVIPSFSTDVIALAGMGALDEPLERVVYNCEEYRKATGDTDAVVSERTIRRFLDIDEGLRKGFSDHGDSRRGFVVLNQCDLLSADRLEKAMDAIGDEYLYVSVQLDRIYGGTKWIS